jgi:hypothetical protein
MQKNICNPVIVRFRVLCRRVTTVLLVLSACMLGVGAATALAQNSPGQTNPDYQQTTTTTTTAPTSTPTETSAPTGTGTTPSTGEQPAGNAPSTVRNVSGRSLALTGIPVWAVAGAGLLLGAAGLALRRRTAA